MEHNSFISYFKTLLDLDHREAVQLLAILKAMVDAVEREQAGYGGWLMKTTTRDNTEK